MTRKNKKGPIPDLEKKIRIQFMRDVENLSFTEIGVKLKISKQAARYHYNYKEGVINKTPIDNQSDKE